MFLFRRLFKYVILLEITYFVDFDYTDNELLKTIFRKEKDFIFRVVFTDEDSSQGIIYKNRRKDYATQNQILFELDNEFYDFYLKYKNSKLFDGIDLRIAWFLNHKETVQYKIKWVRDTKYIFNKINLCQAYDYPDSHRSHITVACNNHSFGKVKGKHSCLKHLSN